MRFRMPVVTGIVALAGLLSSEAMAAEFTDLLDAADNYDDLVDDTYDPFDFNIEPRLRLDFESATISREAACVPTEADLVGQAAQNNPRLVVDRGRCAEPQLISNKEIDYKGQTTALDVTLRAGIYKDLEFKLNVPYVIGSTSGVKFADGVNPTNSSVNPDDSVVNTAARRAFDASPGANNVGNLDLFTGHRFFNLSNDYQEYERKGFADPTISLEWAPFNDERDDTKATLLLGMAYQMPIAPVKEAGNSDVGEGVHKLSWRFASSKRFDWIEPYFGLQYFLPLPATDSPIRRVDKANNGQVFAKPPQSGEITVGTEFIPYEDARTGARYGIDLRFTFGYTSEGRDYTPLFDHFTNSECNGKTLANVLPEFDANGNLSNPADVACSWIVRAPGNAQPLPIYDLANADDSPWSTDGIMTVESYATFKGMLGFYLQPTRYFQLKAQAQLANQQEHYLTNARTGRDAADNLEATPDGTVDLEGPDAAIEKNPVFNAAYDQTGNRFRIQSFNTWTILVTAALQF
ncbi:MAG: hypothetical protein R3E66_07975 [bacterium]